MAAEDNQVVVDTGAHGKTIKNSPYGAGRCRSKFGWGDPFNHGPQVFPVHFTFPEPAPPCAVVAAATPLTASESPMDPSTSCASSDSISAQPSDGRLAQVVTYVGASSLNGVPPLPNTKGGGDRSMSSLMRQYTKKFRVLEHCQPYHNVGDTDVWARWAAMAPMNFKFTVKANNWMTHVRRLEYDEDMQKHIAAFFGDRCRQLGEKLGAVLIQLPPSFLKSEKNLKNLRLVAEAIASSYPFLRGRIAVEFRDRSWNCEEVYSLLRELQWALVITHQHGKGFSPMVHTNSAVVYARLHGAAGLYEGDYGTTFLSRFAENLYEFIQQAADSRRHHSIRSEPTSANTMPQRDSRNADNEDTSCGDSTAHRRHQHTDVYVFFNNNETHIGGLCSSVVDATQFVGLFHAKLNAAGASISTVGTTGIPAGGEKKLEHSLQLSAGRRAGGGVPGMTTTTTPKVDGSNDELKEEKKRLRCDGEESSLMAWQSSKATTPSITVVAELSSTNNGDAVPQQTKDVAWVDVSDDDEDVIS